MKRNYAPVLMLAIGLPNVCYNLMLYSFANLVSLAIFFLPFAFLLWILIVSILFVFKYHPDVNKQPGATEKFKEISAAYEVY